MACGLDIQDCLTEHWLSRIPGDVRGAGKQFSAHCPACHSTGYSLSLTAGKKRVLYQCHRDPPCSTEDVRAALVLAGITCISGSGQRMSRDVLAAEIDRLLGEDISPGAFRLRVAMARWGVDAEAAAAKLGISRAQRYRLLCPGPKTSLTSETEPQVSKKTGSLTSETVSQANQVSKVRRNRRPAA